MKKGFYQIWKNIKKGFYQWIKKKYEKKVMNILENSNGKNGLHFYKQTKEEKPKYKNKVKFEGTKYTYADFI